MKRESVIESVRKLCSNLVKVQNIAPVIIAGTCLRLYPRDGDISIDGVTVGAVIDKGTAEERDADIVKR